MAAMRSFMPESQILFGTDYAPEPIESTVNELPGLKLPRASVYIFVTSCRSGPLSE